MESDSSRKYLNVFADYSGSASEHELINPQWMDLLRHRTEKLLHKLSDGIPKTDPKDGSVYTGYAGVALFYFRLHESDIGSLAHLKMAEHLVEKSLNLRERSPSFLGGDAGPLTVAILVYSKTDRKNHIPDLKKKLYDLQRDVLNIDSSCPDELLYGRSGYLYSLMFLRRRFGPEFIDENLIRKVVDSILKSGRRLSAELNHESPIIYQWHDKQYIGAAHGLSGIAYMLMQARQFMSQSDLERLVRPLVDYVLALQYPSGNFPSSYGSETDKLIHWCHGAPGVIHMLCMAYLVFGNSSFKLAARKSADAIWRRGLLKKGYGMCHGVAGNAYAFLCMYNMTKEPIYLHRAIKFGEFCLDYGKHGSRTADRPLSLFEGLAGTLYFLVDMRKPDRAEFPAFQLGSV